jgi:hypothetical protein
MSPSEVHSSLRRARGARLAVFSDDRPIPNIRNLKEFLIHGVRYVFIPDRGEMTRGIPTGHAAPPLSGKLLSSIDPPPVWPDPEGDTRGQSFSPLYRSVPIAVKNDPQLYELLALVDALRGGQTRERSIASRRLLKRLDRYHDSG